MSTSADTRPKLRMVAAVVVALLQVAGALLLLHGAAPEPHLGWRIPAETPDVIGIVEYYGDDVLTLTTTQGLADVRIDAGTTVTTITAPATPADIRPDEVIIIWGKDPARVILVGAPPP
jgi:hypothetical protein